MQTPATFFEDHMLLGSIASIASIASITSTIWSGGVFSGLLGGLCLRATLQPNQPKLTEAHPYHPTPRPPNSPTKRSPLSQFLAHLSQPKTFPWLGVNLLALRGMPLRASKQIIEHCQGKIP